VAPSSRILKRRSKSSSESGRDLDREASSDQFESDPSPGATRLEVTSKTDVFSICLGKSGSSNSSRLLIKESRLLRRVAAETSGFLESIRWLLKPPKPLTTQIQELKMKVAPSSSTLLVKLRDTIEFSSGCSMNTPTWRARCRYFTVTPTEGYLRGGEFEDRVSPRSGTRRCKGRQGLDRFRPPRW
jgi:hypothetical protein